VLAESKQNGAGTVSDTPMFTSSPLVAYKLHGDAQMLDAPTPDTLQLVASKLLGVAARLDATTQFYVARFWQQL
jgi:hypothetical protein